MAKSPNAPTKPFNKPSSMGGSSNVISKIRKVSAPTPPAPASMKSMGSKLRKGDC